MHKDEAAALFKIIGEPSRVKALKFLYNLGPMSLDELLELGTTFTDIQILKENELIIENDKFEVNKDLLDSLLSFIQTKCGCMSK